MTDNLKENSPKKLIIYWNFFIFMRWVLTLVIIVTLINHPGFQILFLLVGSVIQQCLIIRSWVYSTNLRNIMSLHNEIAVSIYLYLALPLSDLYGSQTETIGEDQVFAMRTQLGWAISLLICLLLFNNLIAYLREVLPSLY